MVAVRQTISRHVSLKRSLPYLAFRGLRVSSTEEIVHFSFCWRSPKLCSNYSRLEVFPMVLETYRCLTHDDSLIHKMSCGMVSCWRCSGHFSWSKLSIVVLQLHPQLFQMDILQSRRVVDWINKERGYSLSLWLFSQRSCVLQRSILHPRLGISHVVLSYPKPCHGFLFRHEVWSALIVVLVTDHGLCGCRSDFECNISHTRAGQNVILER